MDEVLENLQEARDKMNKSNSFSEEYEYWRKWCLLWDEKEKLEQSSREESKAYEL